MDFRGMSAGCGRDSSPLCFGTGDMRRNRLCISDGRWDWRWGFWYG